MDKKRYFQILFITMIGFVSFLLYLQTPSTPSDATAQVIFHTSQGPISFTCAIADTIQEQRQGLLGVSILPPDHGLLFVYDTTQSRLFTMKDMTIPLDIIFINDDNQITTIVEADINQESISSNGPAQYVMEINQGLSKKYKITMGTTVEIIYH